ELAMMAGVVVLAALLEGDPAAHQEAIPSGPAHAVALARSCVRRASAHPEIARTWLRRLHQSAWLPELRLGAERDMGTREVGEARDGAQYGRYALDQLRLEGQATWHLDRLLFDPLELRVSRESVRLAELRQELALTVVRLYYERRRLQLEAHFDPGSSPRDVA